MMRSQCLAAQKFKRYFTPPEPPKRRGRPKKKRRKNTKTDNKAAGVTGKKAGLSARASNELKASLAGVVQAGFKEKAKRINWDVGANKLHRERCADSWENKNDLYDEGDSLRRFCKKNGIDRKVLQRFMESRTSGAQPKKRGRPAFLSESVMRHLVERKLLCFVNNIVPNIFCFRAKECSP